MQSGCRPCVFSTNQSKPPRQQTRDQALVAMISARDRVAFELLYTRHNVRVFRYAARLTGDAALAEDIVVDVFFAVWQSAHTFKSASQVSTWLLSIAHHKAVSEIRRRAKTQIDNDEISAVVDGANDPEATVAQTSRNEIIRKCLMRLSLAQREIIDLVYYQERSIRDVAQIVGIAEGTVKSRMFNARGRLAEFLQAAGISDPQP
jgi:RNA polymerase sigma-70 factor (ECF subfamily)